MLAVAAVALLVVAGCAETQASRSLALAPSGAVAGSSASSFTGFNNETFEFNGQAGSSYNVLSDGSLTVNMELVAAGEGSIVGGVSVLLSSFELYAHVDKAGNMTISVNGLELDIELPARFNKGLISYSPYVPDLGQVITVRQDPFQLSLVAVKEYTDGGVQGGNALGYTPGHLKLHADIISPVTTTAQGVLGATLALQPGQQAPHDEALYRIPSLSHKAAANATLVAEPVVATMVEEPAGNTTVVAQPSIVGSVVAESAGTVTVVAEPVVARMVGTAAELTTVVAEPVVATVVAEPAVIAAAAATEPSSKVKWVDLRKMK